MKFRVGREALGEAVAWVARALPSRPVVPVLAGLLLEAEADSLVLSCFDYEVSARVRIDAEVAEAGTALVPGRLLAEITRSLPSQSAEFTLAADAVGLTCGSAEFMLVTLPLEEFPALPEPPSAAGTVDGGVLAAAAGQVVPAASRDDTLPMLTGVCLDFAGDTITLAATDRYRLAVREIPWTPAGPALRAAALVPARTLADVARTMAAGVPVTIAFGAGGTGAAAAGSTPGSGGPGSDEPRPAEGMISFEGGGRRLTARLIAGEFIRYRSRFPAGSAAGPRSRRPRSPRRSGGCRWSPSGPARCGWRSAPALSWWRPRRRAGPAPWRPWPRTSKVTSPLFPSTRTTCSTGSAPWRWSRRPARRAAPATAAAATERGDGSGDGPAESAGQIRIEFTSPAKPALLTWAADRRPPGDADDGGPDGTAPEVPAFRYLVVPLRVPSPGQGMARTGAWPGRGAGWAAAGQKRRQSRRKRPSSYPDDQHDDRQLAGEREQPERRQREDQQPGQRHHEQHRRPRPARPAPALVARPLPAAAAHAVRQRRRRWRGIREIMVSRLRSRSVVAASAAASRSLNSSRVSRPCA